MALGLTLLGLSTFRTKFQFFCPGRCVKFGMCLYFENERHKEHETEKQAPESLKKTKYSTLPPSTPTPVHIQSSVEEEWLPEGLAVMLCVSFPCMTAQPPGILSSYTEEALLLVNGSWHKKPVSVNK